MKVSDKEAELSIGSEKMLRHQGCKSASAQEGARGLEQERLEKGVG
jgi:hypothetical protein